MQIKYLFSLTTLMLPFSLLAHPGHGETGGFTITHYFVEPVHVIVAISVVVASWLYIRHRIKKNKEIKLQQDK